MPKKEPEATPKRRPGRPKGVSGIVKERTQTLREMAQEYVPEAIRVVASIALDEDARPADRLSAINILIDRGYGRAAQAEPTPADTSDRPLQRIERVIVDVPVVPPKKVREPAK